LIHPSGSSFRVRTVFTVRSRQRSASAHGFNASGIIFDEVHTQRTRDLWDVLATSTGARRQPLIFAITTAGHDRLSICWELHTYAIGLLKLRGSIPDSWFKDIPTAVVDDPTFFAYVRAIPEEADWLDENNWHIANPALGTFRSLEEMRAMAAKAAQLPQLQNAFRRLYLNQWTATDVRWLDMGAWDRSAGVVHEDELRGKLCYGGLDLAATQDLASLALVFPMPEWVISNPVALLDTSRQYRRSREARPRSLSPMD